MFFYRKEIDELFPKLYKIQGGFGLYKTKDDIEVNTNTFNVQQIKLVTLMDFFKKLIKTRRKS